MLKCTNFVQKTLERMDEVKRVTIRLFVPQQGKIRNVLEKNSKKNNAVNNNGLNSGTLRTDVVPPSFREVYALKPPQVHAAIATDPERLSSRYHVIEPTLLEEMEAAIKKVREILFQISDVDLNSLGSSAREHVLNNLND